MTTTNPRRFRHQFIALVISQVLVTAFFSLQWTIIVAHKLITSGRRSIEQEVIGIFTLVLSGYFYYLNNVKSFYISLLTSRLFREKFRQALKTIWSRLRCR